ncbi:unnamed protein product [Rotaria socialis]|uniref:Uncharacterized protein n=1 Tax=Rotaria socialis TaxID=392032 RepID=A0A817ZJ87_9BILA|nr:unnamed protein product [Rotaria socialis]
MGCDGKIDCIDGGQGEIDCGKLYVNEYEVNEFRCGNGLCIPKEFFNDGSFSPDCIDYSDKSLPMGEDPSIETLDARIILLSVVKRQHAEMNVRCHVAMDNVLCTNAGTIGNYPSLFFFPTEPILFGHVRFVYANNLTNDYSPTILAPNYVCYDQQMCDWLPTTVTIHGFTCRSFSTLNNGQTIALGNAMLSGMLHFFVKCSTKMASYVDCSKSKPFRCANSPKCIS